MGFDPIGPAFGRATGRPDGVMGQIVAGLCQSHGCDVMLRHALLRDGLSSGQ